MGTGGPVYGSLDGSVDELAIWSRVLTDAEINAMYGAGHVSPYARHIKFGMVST